jgi:hypothetical protein
MIILSLCAISNSAFGYLGVESWNKDEIISMSANMVAAGHTTQYYRDNWNTVSAQWDLRLEIWAPPFRNRLAWGGYIRYAGIRSNQASAYDTVVFENQYRANPGFGIQCFPFSSSLLHKVDTFLNGFGSPLRWYYEINLMDYPNTVNEWRPKKQIKTGFEYYKALHVNSMTRCYWTELFGDYIWRDANEFTEHYQQWTGAGNVRVGVRYPRANILSAISPYIAADVSKSDNRSYDWENRFAMGYGLRLAPEIRYFPHWMDPITRITCSVEYRKILYNYGFLGQSGTPDHDVFIEMIIVVGEFWK